jgi:hypothetical protein
MGTCVCAQNNNINNLYSLNQKSINVQELENNINSSNNNINNNNILNGNNMNSTNEKSDEKSFETNLLNEINFVRTHPNEYAEFLNENLKLIKNENGHFYFVYNNNHEKKILLREGKNIFIDAIDHLKKIKPLNSLKWNDEIKIDLNQKETINFSNDLLGKLILKKRLKLKEKYSKTFFNLDIFNEPKISVIFQITDEAFNKERRNAILNPTFNYFAVSYINNNKKFLSVSSFAS